MLIRILGYLLLVFSLALALTLREDLNPEVMTLESIRTFVEQFSIFIRIYALFVMWYVWCSLKEIDGD